LFPSGMTGCEYAGKYSESGILEIKENFTIFYKLTGKLENNTAN